MLAQGNALQSLNGGGWVKAMAYINPFDTADPIKQCFNSQLSAAQATTNNCGLTFTKSSEGFYQLDFNFPLVDRFISVTPASIGSMVWNTAPMVEPASASSPQTIHIDMHLVTDSDSSFDHNLSPLADAPFYVIVY